MLLPRNTKDPFLYSKMTGPPPCVTRMAFRGLGSDCTAVEVNLKNEVGMDSL
jgi:hypothetical protein